MLQEDEEEKAFEEVDLDRESDDYDDDESKSQINSINDLLATFSAKQELESDDEMMPRLNHDNQDEANNDTSSENEDEDSDNDENDDIYEEVDL